LLLRPTEPLLSAELLLPTEPLLPAGRLPTELLLPPESLLLPAGAPRLRRLWGGHAV